MGNIGSSQRRFDVLPLGRLTLESLTAPARATEPLHATEPSPSVPAPEPMPAPYPDPTPEPAALPDPRGAQTRPATSGSR